MGLCYGLVNFQRLEEGKYNCLTNKKTWQIQHRWAQTKILRTNLVSMFLFFLFLCLWGTVSVFKMVASYLLQLIKYKTYVWHPRLECELNIFSLTHLCSFNIPKKIDIVPLLNFSAFLVLNNVFCAIYLKLRFMYFTLSSSLSLLLMWFQNSSKAVIWHSLFLPAGCFKFDC